MPQGVKHMVVPSMRNSKGAVKISEPPQGVEHFEEMPFGPYDLSEDSYDAVRR